ncbi:hypothetical protein EDB89DRAFT_2244107 [Lactarius sanguifluus]|nr:hypothetical protein EDB89DRAFT_2244107 [Lactarius sanguifluus]
MTVRCSWSHLTAARLLLTALPKIKTGMDPFLFVVGLDKLGWDVRTKHWLEARYNRGLLTSKIAQGLGGVKLLQGVAQASAGRVLSYMCLQRSHTRLNRRVKATRECGEVGKGNRVSRLYYRGMWCRGGGKRVGGAGIEVAVRAVSSWRWCGSRVKAVAAVSRQDRGSGMAVSRWWQHGRVEVVTGSSREQEVLPGRNG